MPGGRQGSSPLSNEEQDQLKILLNPVLWGQIYLKNRDGSPRIFWPHQVEDLLCQKRNVVHQDGRDVGKTTCIVTDVLHYCFITRGGTGLVAAPFQGQVDTICDEVEWQIYENPDMLASVSVNVRGQAKITKKPYYKIEWKNGSVIHFRPAGAHGDAFRSLHVDRVWVDEAAKIPENGWKAIRQCLNTGGRFKIYSNPNGIRNTTYYRLCQDPNYMKFHWPSWISPTWSSEKEGELVDFYGGKDAAGWQHEVAGEHGAPSYGVFNLQHFNSCRRAYDDYTLTHLYADQFADCISEASVRDRLQTLVPLAAPPGKYWFGADLGYSNDPAEITIWKEEMASLVNGRITIGAGDLTVLKLVHRIHQERISYPIQAELMAMLDRVFEPSGIGVDEGGNGIAVVQDLKTLDKFKDRGFSTRLWGFQFGGKVQVKQGTEMAKKPVKEYMTQLLVGLLAHRGIMFPATDDLIADQMTSHTYTLSNGRVVYSKGNDHIVDSARCMALVRERLTANDGSPDVIHDIPLPVLTDPRF